MSLSRQRVEKIVKHIRAGALPERAVRRMLDWIGCNFMAAYFRGETPCYEAIEILCDLAMDENPAISVPAVQVIYRRAVEGLCDDFTARGGEICNEVLLRLNTAVRRNQRGACMDRFLNGVGLTSEQSMRERYLKTANLRPFPSSGNHKILKVLVPSRVTIGADIVVTSIIVQRLRRRCPDAEIVLIGPAHLEKLFLWPGVRARILPYRRGGDIFERTLAWCTLHELAKEEAAGLPSDAVAVFDPDSRLTQLGLLPMVGDESTFYFSSRAMGEDDASNPSLNELANRWLDSVLGVDVHVRPSVCIDQQFVNASNAFWKPVRASGAFSVVVNFGVGQDERKRIADPFEEELLAALLNVPDTLVLLDSGSSPLGIKRVERLLSLLGRFFQTDFFNEQALSEKIAPFRHGLIGFQGGIDAIGALIAGADAFFGYDSCCQHLACVSTTPSVIVFAGAPNRRFPMRWRPCWNNELFRVIEVDAEQPLADEKRMRLLTEVIGGMNSLRAVLSSLPRN